MAEKNIEKTQVEIQAPALSQEDLNKLSAVLNPEGLTQEVMEAMNTILSSPVMSKYVAATAKNARIAPLTAQAATVSTFGIQPFAAANSITPQDPPWPGAEFIAWLVEHLNTIVANGDHASSTDALSGTGNGVITAGLLKTAISQFGLWGNPIYIDGAGITDLKTLTGTIYHVTESAPDRPPSNGRGIMLNFNAPRKTQLWLDVTTHRIFIRTQMWWTLDEWTDWLQVGSELASVYDGYAGVDNTKTMTSVTVRAAMAQFGLWPTRWMASVDLNTLHAAGNYFVDREGSGLNYPPGIWAGLGLVNVYSDNDSIRFFQIYTKCETGEQWQRFHPYTEWKRLGGFSAPDYNNPTVLFSATSTEVPAPADGYCIFRLSKAGASAGYGYVYINNAAVAELTITGTSAAGTALTSISGPCPVKTGDIISCGAVAGNAVATTATFYPIRY